MYVKPVDEQLRKEEIQMEQSKLNEILDLHKRWLNDEANGVKANLRGGQFALG